MSPCRAIFLRPAPSPTSADHPSCAGRAQAGRRCRQGATRGHRRRPATAPTAAVDTTTAGRAQHLVRTTTKWSTLHRRTATESDAENFSVTVPAGDTNVSVDLAAFRPIAPAHVCRSEHLSHVRIKARTGSIAHVLSRFQSTNAPERRPAIPTRPGDTAAANGRTVQQLHASRATTATMYTYVKGWLARRASPSPLVGPLERDERSSGFVRPADSHRTVSPEAKSESTATLASRPRQFVLPPWPIVSPGQSFADDVPRQARSPIRRQPNPSNYLTSTVRKSMSAPC